MMKKILIASTFFLLAACGTVATPVYEAPEEVIDVEEVVETDGEESEVAVQPSPTPIPPTATSLPPTATPTEVPTEMPTEAPAEAPAVNDPLALVVEQLSSAENGEVLFNQTYETDSGQWACTNCHNIDNDEVKIGPSLWGIPQRAGERVEGQGPYTYIYTSIHNSQDYIVEGFEDATHMPNYIGVLSDADIYDLVAYLMTLEKPE
jgi:cytochrome c2